MSIWPEATQERARSILARYPDQALGSDAAALSGDGRGRLPDRGRHGRGGRMGRDHPCPGSGGRLFLHHVQAGADRAAT